eukprot:SAG31_NODE_3251_length_4490_cov_2.556821_8_plen_76_part_01
MHREVDLNLGTRLLQPGLYYYIENSIQRAENPGGQSSRTKFSTGTRRLEKQRRVGAAKPLDPGDTGRRYSSGTVPL